MKIRTSSRVVALAFLALVNVPAQGKATLDYSVRMRW